MFQGRNSCQRQPGIEFLRDAADRGQHWLGIALGVGHQGRTKPRGLMEALEEQLPGPTLLAPDETPMSWEMISDMQRSGVIIGSHTRSHPLLSLESPEAVVSELTASRSDLESRLGVPIRHLAYPDGRFNTDILEIASAAGYKFGYTTCQHRDRNYPALTIPRRVLWQNSWLGPHARLSPAIMTCHLNGWFDVVTGCKQEHDLGGGLQHRASRLSSEGVAS